MNLNMLSDILTNFKIKYSRDTFPTIIQIGNMDLKFVDVNSPKKYKIKGIVHNQNNETVEVLLIEE